jgi:hypothetical protein
VQLYVNTNPNATAGTYFIPINMSVAQVGQTTAPAVSQTYISVKIAPHTTTAPIITQTSILSNNSKNLTTTIQVYNPTNKIVYDAVVTITLPAASVLNATDLVAGGDPPAVQFANNAYTITWEIPQILPKASSILYYSINNVQDPLVVSGISPSLFAATQTNQSASFKVIDISAPIAYVNGSVNIVVTGLYTGQNSSTATLVLSGPSSLLVREPTQLVKVVPNGMIAASFSVGPMPNTGTQFLHLSIYGPFPNQTYTIPVSVLPQVTGYQGQQSGQSAGSSIFNSPVFYASTLVAAAAVIIIGLLGRRVYKNLNKAKYDRARAQKLVNITERMDSEGKGEEEAPPGPE